MTRVIGWIAAGFAAINIVAVNSLTGSQPGGRAHAQLETAWSHIEETFWQLDWQIEFSFINPKNICATAPHWMFTYIWLESVILTVCPAHLSLH